MAEVILNCPQCQRQLRVTEDLLGRPVKCPACGLTFSVPAGGVEAQSGPMAEIIPPERRPPPVYEPDEVYGAERRPAYGPGPLAYEPTEQGWPGRMVLAPAICLLITGSLGVLVNLAQMVLWLAATDRMRRLMASNPLVGAQHAPGDLDVILNVGIGGLFALISLLIVIAAVQMLRLRAYGLAMAGAILAIIDIGNCCCLLGLPFGIWALVVLANPAVRASFR